MKVRAPSDITYKLGMVIRCEGEKLIIDEKHLPGGFDYKNYFLNNLYLLDIRASKITIKRQGFSIYFLSEMVEKYLHFFYTSDSLTILEGFILGNSSSFSDSFKDSLRLNGIIHLFAVSGLHVSIIIAIFEKIFSKTRHKNKIINVILGIYLLITRFTVSIRRAVISYFLKTYCSYKGLKFTSLDITSIVYIVFLLFNPYLIYHLGFVLSFFATFVILILSESVKNMGKIKQMLTITTVINILTLPILINTSNNFNLLTPFINLIMVFLVETLILPLSFLVFIFPIFNNLFNYIITSFINLSEVITEFCFKTHLILIIGTISSFVIVLFYIILYLNLKKNKKKYLNIINKVMFILILCFILFSGNIKLTPKITFFDVAVGDATLIEYKNEKILIDTGIGYNNELTTSLKSLGVKRLDYVIITHNHKDHNGEIENITKFIKVKNIVISPFDDYLYPKGINLIRVRKNDRINSKYFSFLCLNPSRYSENVNNNSLVLLLKINNTSIIFTGDAEKEVEEDITKSNIGHVDILKVGHHGSITSTTLKFLNHITPKDAVILSGHNNSFEFPSQVIIDRLKKYHINTYITKYNYTITLFIFKNCYKFRVMKPK